MASYSDRLLTDTDRKNLEMIENPPPAPEEPEPETAPETLVNGAEEQQGCSCATGSAQGWGIGLIAALPFLFRRRP